ncbi:NAD(P)/FAD-dependent oxidoreductase [Kordia sp. YSTF-M3]|uniref:NAD(P)/FAD-dependent oxidoreductase n=1 Tax=Kordia aestuariivivens TaxID=2759037 RepID=A0ABR7QA94_9FLAO|nr:NAD(P)/FAD-dependent oxidoreductase [Kordia aestuariivivens]MBC8755487.1 NAD(P)/FAD-dependent oxidoreductase [Kordia aestuariivivens]
MQIIDVLIIGGGAAGFFTAINVAEKHPEKSVVILERGKEFLTKVRISGGGRCNVTHACFDPKELVNYYPRGEKELLGPFHQFCCGDTMAWFEERGVELKIEDDGRIFPVTDSSQTIIDCFLNESKKYNVDFRTNHAVKSISKANDLWQVDTSQGILEAKNVVMTTGSNPKMWAAMETLGHSIIPAVPSLFTFNIKDARIKDLLGIATQASVKVVGTKLETNGPLLITHWGMSGPGILKLSAWGARILADKHYSFQIQVNWLDDVSKEDCLENIKDFKIELAKKMVQKNNPFEVPKRLWQRIVAASGIKEDGRWADLNKQQTEQLASQLTEAIFNVKGKSTFKEEFVTAGGIDLKEVNFKTFESRKQKNLYFAGEILNIDAITGGFNFQNAWTGSYIIAKSIS